MSHKGRTLWSRGCQGKENISSLFHRGFPHWVMIFGFLFTYKSEAPENLLEAVCVDKTCPSLTESHEVANQLLCFGTLKYHCLKFFSHKECVVYFAGKNPPFFCLGVHSWLLNFLKQKKRERERELGSPHNSKTEWYQFSWNDVHASFPPLLCLGSLGPDSLWLNLSRY